MRDIDSEVVFNTLLAEGIDVPTAYAASVHDSEPQAAGGKWTAAFVIVVVLVVAWLLW